MLVLLKISTTRIEHERRPTVLYSRIHLEVLLSAPLFSNSAFNLQERVPRGSTLNIIGLDDHPHVVTNPGRKTSVTHDELIPA
jgi:hypothetical protein